LPALVAVQFRFWVEEELDQRKMDTNQVMALARDVKNGQVPFPMRNSVFEEGKQSHTTGAMRLMHATVPFMSAYVALPHIQRRMTYASNEASCSTGY
jgi:hypothetical protein